MVINPKSLENLHPITKDNVKEIASRGGKAKSKTPAKYFNALKYCTQKCPYYDRCPAITSSLTLVPIEQHGKKRYPCFIKRAPREVGNLFQNLFIKGEEGLIQDILSTLLQLRLATMPKRGDGKVLAKDLKMVIDAACEVKKTVYGDRQKIEHSGVIVNINETRPETE